ncbi:hypothetical protein H0H93_008249 [Arthromyces matolae]|nr:hypothetical protein H0H93_008249 [Arthromyces matolae]
MFTPFNEERKRKINLGGTSTAVSHSALLGNVHALRTEDLNCKNDMKAPRGIPEYQNSWLVLIKQVATILLSSVARNPNKASSIAHLKVLNALLSRSVTTTALGAAGAYVSAEITTYLLKRDFYSFISQSLLSIPLNARSSPNLPSLATLAIQPFSTFEIDSKEYITSLNALFRSILSIPLLPNRIPPAALVDFSANIPFSQLGSLDVNFSFETTKPDDKINLLANLQVFVPPRYKTLDGESRRSYFTLVSGLLNASPTKILNPVPPKPKSTTTTATTAPSALASDSEDDEDDEEHRTKVTVVTTFAPSQTRRQPLTPPDSRTLKRLSTLPSTAHLTSLLSLPSSPLTRPALITLLFALCVVWPGDVPQRILALSPSLAMMTMGDDEFFGSTNSAGAGGRVLGSSSSFGGSIAGAAGAGVTIPRNPLSLDDLVEWSAKLKNVAFGLYWREDGREAVERRVARNVRCTWESVRERVTKCLVGIHTRDSRKPFVPPNHWLVTSQIDVQSFVEAAIYEERELASSSSASSLPMPVIALPASTAGFGARTRTLHTSHSKRQLAHLSPRLGVLNNIPFAIPFDTRVSVFRIFVLNDAVATAERRNANSSNRERMMED